MTKDIEMKVKKVKAKKGEKAAAESGAPPAKEKKTKIADGGVKKKKRKVDFFDSLFD